MIEIQQTIQNYSIEQNNGNPGHYSNRRKRWLKGNCQHLPGK